MAAARCTTALFFVGIEAWPGCAGGDHCDVAGHFFGGLNADVPDFAVFHDGFAAFIDGEAAGDFVPVLLDGEFHSVLAAVFFVGFGEENHVAIQVRAGAFQGDEGGEVGDERTFIVEDAAAIDDAVFYDAAEGIDASIWTYRRPRYRDAPSRAGRAKDRGRHVAERRATRKPRPGVLSIHLGGNAVFLQDVCDVFCGGDFVARRIDGVDFDQALKPGERFALKRENRGAGRDGGLRLELRAGIALATASEAAGVCARTGVRD